MNKMAKTMLMTSQDRGGYRNEMDYAYRSEGGSMGYQGNNARMEARGGQGAYYGGGSDEAESRFRDRRGREHYDNGRFAPKNGYDGAEMGGYEDVSSVYPFYEKAGREGGRSGQQPRNAMPVSGFGGEFHSQPGRREGVPRQEDDELEPLTEEAAKRCLAKMKNEDGSTGPHWTLEQIKQVMAQKMLPGDPVEMWVAMNMMWSDYYSVAKRFNANNTDFYLEMAKAFLHDKDASDMKLEKYLEWVVK